MDDLIALRALGALVTYPRAELRAALPEIGAALAGSPLLPHPERERLAALIDEMRSTEPLELEARYVALFDHARATSLNLFEHLHGESRDRGVAMVELKQIYADAGFRLTASELPDHLPVLLEYLSCRTLGEARAMLGDCAHILRAIGEALLARGSRHAAVFAALLALAKQPGLDWSKAAEAPAREPFDEEWAEAPAFAAQAPGAAAAPIRFVTRNGDAQ
ncbi:MAG: nitrate reductase molybdenum cofactor assembly chaperone [Betaproteobacteria bacterium]|nr:nitrate reductase molybdenum cofactor assembly chaperone [Betaproteobacteria bacterium]